MFEVSKFCFCCELETGGKIIGWFNAVVSVIGIITWGALIGAYAAVKDNPDLQVDETTNAGEKHYMKVINNLKVDNVEYLQYSLQLA